MPFTARIHRFFKVCLDINALHNWNIFTQNNTFNYTENSCKISYNNHNPYRKEIEKLNHSSEILLRYIYQKSIRENYYFFDCPSQVYTNHYENRKQSFLDHHIDSGEIDFVQSELENLNNPKSNQIINIKYKCINKFLAKKNKELVNFNHLRENQNSATSMIRFNKKSMTIDYSQLVKTDNTWRYSHQKKVNFLKKKLGDLKNGLDSSVLSVNEAKPVYKITTNQAVILFDSLGIFSHPSIENMSLVKQSDLISSILKKNSKNVSVFIGKLNNSPSENGKQYLQDIRKVGQLLNDNKK